jgi:hypothetical protein
VPEGTTHKVGDASLSSLVKKVKGLWVAALQFAEKITLIVIPNEVRNLSVLKCQEKRDPSARSVPRNDTVSLFSAT